MFHWLICSPGFQHYVFLFLELNRARHLKKKMFLFQNLRLLFLKKWHAKKSHWLIEKFKFFL